MQQKMRTGGAGGGMVSQQKIKGGGPFPISGGGGMTVSPNLVDKIKQIQRSSQQAKEQWWEYCDGYGEGNRDPSRHDDAFLTAFIEQYEQWAGDGGDAGGCWGSPKRENGARESRKESETNLTRVRRWTWIDLWEKTFIFEINQEINK